MIFPVSEFKGKKTPNPPFDSHGCWKTIYKYNSSVKNIKPNPPPTPPPPPPPRHQRRIHSKAPFRLYHELGRQSFCNLHTYNGWKISSHPASNLSILASSFKEILWEHGDIGILMHCWWCKWCSHPNIYNSIIHNSPQMEAAQMSVNWRMDKLKCAVSTEWTWLWKRKEYNTDAHCNMKTLC